jgi:catechol 2,3-dioxygenase-like lactoylglutathione lyase family enzyme
MEDAASRTASAPDRNRLRRNKPMKLLLELVVVPVSDVDRAKEFYGEKLGFNVDFDTWPSDNYRVVQLTPPGSGCSIALQAGELPGMAEMAPGSLHALQLVTPDIRASREELAGRGVDISEVQVYDAGGLRPMREGDALDNVGFAFFSDPDGNRWAVQQISARA